MTDTILMTGHLELDPTKRDAFIEAAGAVMAATKAEEGCERYEFSADLTDPGRFYMGEQWTSQAALDGHMASEHLAAFMGAMGTFGVTGASLTQWTGGTPTKLM
jgi:quinol monooxygenase YgiN